MALNLSLSPCAMIRLIVATLSFVGFVVFLMVLLRPPPSILLPNLPHTGHKVSVLLLPPFPSRNISLLVTSTAKEIIKALTSAHLEAELIIVGKGAKAEAAVQPLQVKGHHVELVTEQPTVMHTLIDALSRAHFSQVLVYGDMRIEPAAVVSELVPPVVGGKVDMAIAEYSDKSSLISFLSYPLTGSLAAGSNSTVFCMHTAVWQKDCHAVSLTASSPSLELLARCDLDSLSSSTFPMPSPHQNQLGMLAQLLHLYWQLHPVWCSILTLLSAAGLLQAARLQWQRHKRHTHKRPAMHTLHSGLL